MKNRIKYPAVIMVLLILLAYMISVILWNVELYTFALFVFFANSLIGVFGVIISAKEITRTKVKITITVNVICLIITVIAALMPFALFIYTNIYGF